MSTPANHQSHQLQLLQQLVKDIPHADRALLLSSDGIDKAAVGMGKTQAEEFAAIISGLFSLSRSAGQLEGRTEGVRQVVVELDNHLMFVTAAASGAVLAVVTGREADPGLVGEAMSKLAASVERFLETPVRAVAA